MEAVASAEEQFIDEIMDAPIPEAVDGPIQWLNRRSEGAVLAGFWPV
jgi:hypothetical protein